MMEEIKTKICTKCLEVFPKTKEYFFEKVTKQKNKNGVSVYYGFRSMCKKCHGKDGLIRMQKKKSIELGCSLEDYPKVWKVLLNKQKIKDVVAKQKLKKNQYAHYLRLKNKGIVSNEVEYLEGMKERISVARKNRPSKYKSLSHRRSVEAKRNSDKLSNCYVANHLFGCKVSDLPLEIIETKRLSVQIKRELGIGSGIKNKQLN